MRLLMVALVSVTASCVTSAPITLVKGASMKRVYPAVSALRGHRAMLLTDSSMQNKTVLVPEHDSGENGSELLRRVLGGGGQQASSPTTSLLARSSAKQRTMHRAPPLNSLLMSSSRQA